MISSISNGTRKNWSIDIGLDNSICGNQPVIKSEFGAYLKIKTRATLNNCKTWRSVPFPFDSVQGNIYTAESPKETG